MYSFLKHHLFPAYHASEIITGVCSDGVSNHRTTLRVSSFKSYYLPTQDSKFQLLFFFSSPCPQDNQQAVSSPVQATNASIISLKQIRLFFVWRTYKKDPKL
ncbi:hypothetical protein ACB092_05G155700 [Castanea dentata]